MFGIISAIASGIATAFSVVGSAVCSCASALVASLPKALEVAKIVLDQIAEVVIKVAEVLDLCPENEDVEELGAKATQVETRLRKEDESMEEYLDYLRNEVVLDKEKMLKMTQEQKLQCKAVGTAMLTEALSEKTGVAISPAFLIAMNKMKFSEIQFASILKKFAENEITTMDVLTDYLKGTLSDDKMPIVSTSLIEAEKQKDPTATFVTIQENIDEYKELLNK